MKTVLQVDSMKMALAKLLPGFGLAVAVTLLTAACATESGQSVASVGVTADGKVAQTEKQVCRSEKRTGTNFPKRTCKTAEQWAAIDSKQHGDAYDYTRQVFENGSVTGAKNCGQSGQMASC